MSEKKVFNAIYNHFFLIGDTHIFVFILNPGKSLDFLSKKILITQIPN